MMHIKTDFDGKPWELTFNPVPVDRAPLKTIIRTLMKQVLRDKSNILITINLPGNDEPCRLTEKNFQTASEKGTEEEWLEQAANMVDISDQVSIRKHKFNDPMVTIGTR